MAKKKNGLANMLDDPNKKVTETYGSNGMLSRLFRIILKDRDIGGYRFAILMNQFLSDPKNNIPNNKLDQTSNRGNLNKEFQKGQMTWKVFCKGMRFLQIVRFRLILEADWRTGETTSHNLAVNLEFPDVEVDDDDDTTKLAEDMEHVPYLDHDLDN